MKLVKALKIKNRLAGEVTKLQEILRRENARRSDNPSQIKCNEIDDLLKKKMTDLVMVKTKIAQANVGIYNRIALLAETKNQINFYNGLPTKEGTEVAFIGRDQEKLEYKWTSYLNRQQIEGITSMLDLVCAQLQDDIDNYNATTDVDITEVSSQVSDAPAVPAVSVVAEPEKTSDDSK